jgi:hypothetical protein
MHLNNTSAVPLLGIPSGNLVVHRMADGPVVGMRVVSPDPNYPTLLIFRPMQPPVWVDLKVNPTCIDLAVRATVNVSEVPGAFTQTPDAYAAGNLAIEAKSVCVIAAVPSGPGVFSGEALVEIPSGRPLIATGAQRWYARKWQLGYLDHRGEFAELWAKTP